MKNLQNFNEFLNEESINEGVSTAYKALVKEYPNGLVDAWDKSLKHEVVKVEKILGAKAKDIQQVDEYSAETDVNILKAFTKLKKIFRSTKSLDSENATLEYDAKINVTFFQDQFDGFKAYQITKTSKI